MQQAQRLLIPQVHQVVWESFDLPSTPDPHTIVVEARRTFVSAGTELAIYTGTHTNFTSDQPTFQPLPFHPGYAFVGTVTAMGTAVPAHQPTLQLGDRVLIEAPHGSAATVDVRKALIIPLPDTVSTADGALLRMAGIALTAVRVAPLQLGESVAIFGMGIVGQLAAQLFHLNGAHPVLGIDRIRNRLDVAEEHGIVPLLATEPALTERVQARTNGAGADVVIEATGNPAVVAAALDAAAIGGRVVLLGSTRGPVEQLDLYTQIHRKRIRLIGAHELAQDHDYAQAIRWNRKTNLLCWPASLPAGACAAAG